MCVRPCRDLRWTRREGAQPRTLLRLQETSSGHVDCEQDVHSLLLRQLRAEERIRGLAYCRCVECYSQPVLRNEPADLFERNHIKMQIRVFGEFFFFRPFELTFNYKSNRCLRSKNVLNCNFASRFLTDFIKCNAAKEVCIKRLLISFLAFDTFSPFEPEFSIFDWSEGRRLLADLCNLDIMSCDYVAVCCD